jgi:hypothetical protein
MKKQQFAFIFLALWLIIISESMILIQKIDLEIFFILGLINFLVIMQLLEHKFIQPDYTKYIKYNMVMWTVIFGVIVAHKISIYI